MTNKKEKEENTAYRTFQIQIPKEHDMYNYFLKMCENAKNMYNTTNFYIRQVYTSMKSEKILQPLQKEVMDTVTKYLPGMNKNQEKAYKNNLQKETKKPVEKQKVVKLNLFDMPTKEKSFVSYGFLDALFKLIDQNDYRSLPVQSSQLMMKAAYDDWNSFFESMKKYKITPSTFTGRPRIPKYKRSPIKEVKFTNQDCVIKNEEYIKFPFTKQQLKIGKLASYDGTLQEVRVIPSYGEFVLELVFKKKNVIKLPKKPSYNRIMGIDLGVSNLATIVMNTGHKPVLVKGNVLKSINQYYNKQRAFLFGALRKGKNHTEGDFQSKRLTRLDQKRFLKIKDLFHKMTYNIVKLAKTEKIDTIIVGKNNGWKQKVEMDKKTKQHLVTLPHNLFVKMLTYKANAEGIHVVETEESYTSKASFLDMDNIPTYGKEQEKKPSFSGKRIKRGLYRSKNGIIINADVNGAANIIRKVVSNAFDSFKSNGVEGVVSHPMRLSVR